MRYVIQRFKLDKNHPLWADEEVYRIVDTFNGFASFSCYTTLEAAEKMLSRKDVLSRNRLIKLKNGV